MKLKTKNIQNSNQTKIFFERINKIGRLLARMTEKKREHTVISIRSEREGITTDPTDIKKIIREYYKQLYTHKFGTLDEIDHFLGKTHGMMHL